MALMPNIYRRVVDGEPVLDGPFPKQAEILHALIAPPYERVLRRVNLCCGWGFGKTTVGIDAAQMMLQLGMNGVFLEPNVKLMNTLFLSRWIDTIPPELYTLNRGDHLITWNSTGAKMIYDHRSITGSMDQTLQKMQGWTLGFYIDDEASSSCSMKVHTSLSARVRDPKSPLLIRLTLSTPRMGDYATLLNQPNSVNIYGKSEDNPHLDRALLADMRANMSRAQQRRDMDGELVALEDMLWRMVDLDQSWPAGNVDDHHPRFDPSMPWYLCSDLGSATGADVIVQKIDRGFNYSEPRWVIVADFCPQSDASVRRRYQKLRSHFGTPSVIAAGRDYSTRAATDGATPAYFAQKTWGNVRIVQADEAMDSKMIQYDVADYMFCNALGERRLTIARDLVGDPDNNIAPTASLDPDSKRGILEMIQQDTQLPEEERRQNEFLPKGRKIRVQHVRDALLMGASEIMRPPRWAGDPDRKMWDSTK